MIELIILDVDGVLTDGKKYYDSSGKVLMKTFCDKDLTAIKRFKALKIPVVFITGDPFNFEIAKNRNIDIIVNRQNGYHKDKIEYLPEICKQYNVNPNEIIFVGDDIFDIQLLKAVGYGFCPANSPDDVQCVCKYILESNSGENCIMELFDFLVNENLIKKDFLGEHLQKVYKLDIKEKF